MLMTLLYIWLGCWIFIGLLWVALGVCKLFNWTGKHTETMKGVFK